MVQLPFADAAPSPWLRYFETPDDACDDARAAWRTDDAVLEAFRARFVELYRLVWSLQLGVPAGEPPDLVLRELRDASGTLTRVTLSSVRHGHYLGQLAPGMRRTLVALEPVCRTLRAGASQSIVAVRVEPVGSLLCTELCGAFGAPIERDARGLVFAELSFRLRPAVFMDAVARQLRALGVRPGEAA